MAFPCVNFTMALRQHFASRSLQQKGWPSDQIDPTGSILSGCPLLLLYPPPLPAITLLSCCWICSWASRTPPGLASKARCLELPLPVWML